jgi:hypothetical protein
MANQSLTDEERKARRDRRRAERRAEQAKKRKKAQLLGGRVDRANPANRCRAKTRQSGAPCPMYRAILEHPETGKIYRAATCYAHLPPKIREEFRTTEIGGAEAAKGNKGSRPRPKPNQILREIFEQEVTQWIQPYIEALQATKPVVVGNGRHARIETVPDHRTRQQAAEALWDRIYGKPKQQMEHSGVDGGPIEVEVPNNKKRQEAVARILADAGALPEQEEKVAKTTMAARAAARN